MNGARVCILPLACFAALQCWLIDDSLKDTTVLQTHMPMAKSAATIGDVRDASRATTAGLERRRTVGWTDTNSANSASLRKLCRMGAMSPLRTRCSRVFSRSSAQGDGALSRFSRLLSLGWGTRYSAGWGANATAWDASIGRAAADDAADADDNDDDNECGTAVMANSVGGCGNTGAMGIVTRSPFDGGTAANGKVSARRARFACAVRDGEAGSAALAIAAPV